MSILNVVKLSHGFGDRAIFTDVSFRLLKGEHVGFVGMESGQRSGSDVYGRDDKTVRHSSLQQVRS